MTFFHTLYGQSLKTDIGTNFLKKYAYLFSIQTNRQWMPIIKIKRTFIVKDHWVHRIQFPLCQAAACSIHVSQSSTYLFICLLRSTFDTTKAILGTYALRCFQQSYINCWTLYWKYKSKKNQFPRKYQIIWKMLYKITNCKQTFNSATNIHWTFYSIIQDHSKNTSMQ